MKIETKFDIGQTIYVIKMFNQVKPEIIKHICIYDDGIVYATGYGYTETYYENCSLIFADEESAIKEALNRQEKQLRQKME